MSTKIGYLGEQLVIQWLQSKSYRILHHSWRCQWGEIDIIAEDKASSSLVFVEVKTRSGSNWDSDGLEAVSLSKQQKISRSAAFFLGQNPQYLDFYMRFDVAIVKYQKQHHTQQSQIGIDCSLPKNFNNFKSSANQFITEFRDNYCLQMINYLENAFETN